MTNLIFERLSNSTLDELAEYFEELPEFGSCPEDYDVQYGVSHGLITCIMLYLLYATEWGIEYQGWM